MTLRPKDIRLLGACAVASVLAGTFRFIDAGKVVPFLASLVALALLAMLVGHCVDEMGERLSAGATGVVQSALGNLPEIFVSIFALRAGMVNVVKGAIVGSILANILFVLGLAFVFGGLKNGVMKFGHGQGRSISLLLVLAISVMCIPSLTSLLHTPAAAHEEALSIIVAVVLLSVFALSLPQALKAGTENSDDAKPTKKGAKTLVANSEHKSDSHTTGAWPLWFAVTMLGVAGVGAAFVSEWFVHALEPAMGALGISEMFAGLVVVAIAGNAIENVVGIQLAAKGQADYAVSVILQSPLQVALVVAPLLVLVSTFMGTGVLTLVFPPLLLAALIMTVIITFVVVFDGEATWLEGVTLIALYCVIAVGFWWG